MSTILQWVISICQIANKLCRATLGNDPFDDNSIARHSHLWLYQNAIIILAAGHYCQYYDHKRVPVQSFASDQLG